MYCRLILIAWLLPWCGPVFGLDHVTLSRDGKEVRLEGRVLATATGGGIALLARDGVLWTVEPDELVEQASDETPFEPLSADELSEALLAELPSRFDVHRTAHYLIPYNTSRAYALWCGSLFERLYTAFTNYWSRRGFDLKEPEFPLVAIVFADRRSYAEYSEPEVSEAIGSIVAYYSPRSNRMVMYDLTGLQAAGGPRTRTGTLAQINRILAQPGAAWNVATIVHEATHQIAFNCGLHTRYSDCPLWFSEGIAVYFETPDLSSSTGWRNIGSVSRPRLVQFRKYLRRRPPDSLETLLSDDSRLRDPQQSRDAYAEAWALTYFLIRQRLDEYIQYLKLLSQKKPFLWDEPETRLAEFKQVFGEDLKKLDGEFLRYMLRVR